MAPIYCCWWPEINWGRLTDGTPTTPRGAKAYWRHICVRCGPYLEEKQPIGGKAQGGGEKGEKGVGDVMTSSSPTSFSDLAPVPWDRGDGRARHRSSSLQRVCVSSPSGGSAEGYKCMAARVREGGRSRGAIDRAQRGERSRSGLSQTFTDNLLWPSCMHQAEVGRLVQPVGWISLGPKEDKGQILLSWDSVRHSKTICL